MSRGLGPKVVVVEDDEALRTSLVYQLEAHGLRVKSYCSAEAFLMKSNPRAEGCVVVDVNLPGMSGLILIEKLKRSGSRLVPVVMAGAGDVSTAVRAMRAGAVDYIEKPFAYDTFRKSVLAALAMAELRVPFQRDTEEAARKFATLSDREREVFCGMLEGKQGKQIAIDFGISPRTVEVHRSRIMAKLDAAGLTDILRLGLILEIGQRLQPSFGWPALAAQTQQRSPL